MAERDIELDDVARIVLANTATIASLTDLFGALFEVTRALLRHMSESEPDLADRLLELAEPVLAARAPETIAAARAYLTTITTLDVGQSHVH